MKHALDYSITKDMDVLIFERHVTIKDHDVWNHVVPFVYEKWSTSRRECGLTSFHRVCALGLGGGLHELLLIIEP